MTYFYTNCYMVRNKLYLRGYTNGKAFFDQIDYKPFLFTPKENGDYRTTDGKPLIKREFNSISEWREFLSQYKEVDNFPIYGEISPIYQFLSQEFPGKIKYDPSEISIVSIDIENKIEDSLPNAQLAETEITAITLVKNGKSITLGCKHYNGRDYILCNDEKDLLNKFLDIWNSPNWKPDIVTGWNIESYDIVYIVNRLKRILGQKSVKLLSPIGIVNEREVTRGKYTSTHTEYVYDIAGIAQLDYLNLYRKFCPTNRESYRLDNIAFVELGSRKLDYSEFNNLDELYEKDFDKFIDYNKLDSMIIDQLEHKLGYIRLVMSIAYKAKINYADALATVRPWDTFIHNKLLEQKIAIPQQQNALDHSIVGAYVKDPIPGLYHSVVSFDYRSLYPSLIIQHNMSPDTIIDQIDLYPITNILASKSIGEVGEIIKQRNVTIVANGAIFLRDRTGFIPQLIQELFDERIAVRKEMTALKKEFEKTHAVELNNQISLLDNEQYMLKIFMNSCYGALANKYFRWYDSRIAEGITLTGQLFIQWIEKHVNEYLNKVLATDGEDFVIAGDTDSNYINLDPLVKKCGLDELPLDKIIDFLDKVCKDKLKPFIQKECINLGTILNVHKQFLQMERESICNKAIWRGKKNYVLNVWDSEGVRYTEPKLKMKGIEAVRSSTPLCCRDHIRESLKIIMQGDEKQLQLYIKNFEKEFMNLPYEEIAFPRGVDGISKYYDSVLVCKKGTPIHVRGSIIYNEYLKRNNLTKKFKLIGNKDKIKFIHLKEPNIFSSYVIAIPDEGNIPKQLKIDQYVDRQMQWEKAFLSPIKSITDVINWSTEKRSSIESFFI